MSTTPTPRTLRRSTARVLRSVASLAGLAVAAGAVTAALPAAQADAAVGGRTFYVSPQGSDANSGTDANHPFASLGKVSNGFLQPGDTLLLQGGATFTTKLAVWSSGTATAPITVGGYGAGTPTLTGGCLDLGGSYITVSGLMVTQCGDDSGIWVYGDNDVISHNEATHNIQAIVVDTHAQGTRIVDNNLHDNDRMAPNTPGAFDDYGAIAIVVDGDDTEVADNTISHNVAASADFGEDGSAVEIYGGQGTDVHDNVAIDNSAFTELGNARSANTTFTDNRVYSDLASSQFLVTRGAQDYFGPVTGTTAVGNVVMLTGAQSTGYICYAGCTPALLTMSDNVLNVAGRIGYVEGSLGGGDNIYWGGQTSGLPMLPGDKVADPGTLDFGVPVTGTVNAPTLGSTTGTTTGTTGTTTSDGGGALLNGGSTTGTTTTSGQPVVKHHHHHHRHGRDGKRHSHRGHRGHRGTTAHGPGSRH